MKQGLFLLLFFLSLSVGAQHKQLEGKITNEFEVEGIHILNTTSRINTVTNTEGIFSIQVKLGDTLFVSSVKYIPQKVAITAEIYNSTSLEIQLEEIVNELDEVFLGPNLTGNIEQDLKNIKTEKAFNFDDVGIPGFKGKPEEKIVPVVPTIGLVTAVDIEALYKHISGYYKKLRIQRKWEGQHTDAIRIINFYTAAFFTEAYQIPENRTYDFMIYCIETTELQKNFKNENFAGVLSVFDDKSKEYRSRLEFSEEKE
ncbi:carboxypeptidase-like regulatory domain-containing protein [Jejudonia soesokkakensis]|uniref:Carboxypeptidase-like regulatory domain-containing protein n=1 Tax=Jejudonia soesokkakensis TaxID=1323432 RepID=A0ABW2MRZ0_9FLAO